MSGDHETGVWCLAVQLNDRPCCLRRALVACRHTVGAQGYACLWVAVGVVLGSHGRSKRQLSLGMDVLAAAAASYSSFNSQFVSPWEPALNHGVCGHGSRNVGHGRNHGTGAIQVAYQVARVLAGGTRLMASRPLPSRLSPITVRHGFRLNHSCGGGSWALGKSGSKMVILGIRSPTRGCYAGMNYYGIWHSCNYMVAELVNELKP